MKILFITPQPSRKVAFTKMVFSSNLTLKQLYAITPREHDVEVLDEKYKKIDFEKDYDIIGISIMTFNSLRGYQLADEFRRRGKTVVIGGYHATALPQEAKQHADSVVIGEGEIVWPQLLKDYKDGKLKPFYRTCKLIDAKLIPAAEHDLDPKVPMIDSVQATRGCPVGCQFCAIRNVEGTNYRMRDIKSVIDEIRNLKSERIFFADSSLTINPEFTKSLFREMIGLGKKFSCFGNINVLMKDEELLRLSSEAGCGRWLIGIESFNQENLINVGKRTNKVEFYSKAIKKIHDYGIGAHGMFIFGFDNDTLDTFNNTIDAINQIELKVAFFSILTPYPGTQIYYKLEKEGRILTRDWSKYLSRCADQSVVFQPKNMTPDQLKKGSIKAAQRYYSYASIIKRAIDEKDVRFKRMFSGTLVHWFYKRKFRF